MWKGLKEITNYKTPSPNTVENQQLANDLNEFCQPFGQSSEHQNDQTETVSSLRQSISWTRKWIVLVLGQLWLKGFDPLQMLTSVYLFTQLPIFKLLFLIYLFLFYYSFYYVFFCSVNVILLHCGSFCHENKFLVCVNIPGNKAHSDSEKKNMIPCPWTCPEQSAVSKHVNRKLSERKKSGRKRRTTKQENRSLMRIVKQNRFKNLGELHDEWTEAGVKASRATTHRDVSRNLATVVIRDVLPG